MKKIILILILFLSGNYLFSQTFDLQYVQVLNNGTNFDVKIQARGSAGFKLGTSNIGFNFNNSNLGSPVLLTAHNFSGTFYNSMTVTNPLPGVCSINIELFVPNVGTLVSTEWTDVATIRFPTINPDGNSTFTFRTTGQNQVHLFLDDNFTELSAGLLFTLGPVALPVELTGFTASMDSKSVKLEWQTITEVNNSGFAIERAEIENHTELNPAFTKIGFVDGHILSNSPKYYSYIDKTVSPKKLYIYRLKQIDSDGQFSYSKYIEVNTVNQITKFLLNQNYPNPFNPSTLINYQLSENCLVNLKIYNILGNEIATLVNGYQEAGNYDVQFSTSALSKNLVSGIYIYKLTAGKFSSVRKMILAK